jgi:hypothetical protein
MGLFHLPFAKEGVRQLHAQAVRKQNHLRAVDGSSAMQLYPRGIAIKGDHVEARTPAPA